MVGSGSGSWGSVSVFAGCCVRVPVWIVGSPGMVGRTSRLASMEKVVSMGVPTGGRFHSARHWFSISVRVPP